MLAMLTVRQHQKMRSYFFTPNVDHSPTHRKGRKHMLSVERLTEEQRQQLIDRVAKAFSDILSDKYECKVNWRFEKKSGVDSKK